MSPAEVADVQGVVITVALVVAILVALAAVFDRRTRRGVTAALAGTGTLLGAGVAGLATAGSLWFSEGAHFPPCILCWYQRIAMYPLVVVLGIAAVRNSATGRITGITLAVAGLAVSAYHIVIEAFPDLDGGGCDPTNPCTLRWVEGLGFWTIPRMAAACFVLVVALTGADHLAQRSLHPSQGVST